MTPKVRVPTSLGVLWLRLLTSNIEGMGSSPVGELRSYRSSGTAKKLKKFLKRAKTGINQPDFIKI